MAPVYVTAAEAACGLGSSLTECESSLRDGRGGLRPLHELLGGGPVWADLPSGWIPDRKFLSGRRYGMTSNAAVRIAKMAAAVAQWGVSELESAWLFVGTSRGNAAELLGEGAIRRPVRQFAASNSMHSEVAAAVSIELNMRGPWQVLANGCAAGLDALGLAWLAVASGMAPRALVVAVDLPLVPGLLRGFMESRLLSVNGRNDPFSLEAAGFFPAEAAVAVTLERNPSVSWCETGGYQATSDAWHILTLPPDGRGLRDCLRACAGSASGEIAAVCPHATGTREQGAVESRVLREVLAECAPAATVHLLKPWTGHALGASGLLDVALLAAFLRRGELPPNLPDLTNAGLPLPAALRQVPSGSFVLKTSNGMGGHNAAVWLRSC